MKAQAGPEYLEEMYITITVERTYGILKVKILLPHAKALLIDAGYIGVHSGVLIDLLEEIIDWRRYSRSMSI